ncbi:hypothetical protein D187_008439 [Cystobacter fuscus DSM 2262]|uniref:LTD domain-containing protein n=1 Tax=Cystobacter fuscus (strain ATCC 25194 / DSM 2262 / NBRC 100088 / M29) TaxID=1242864 RepID=S9PIL8_CYSF2|nr:DUF2278 family protein [Cystobacter fuscus]EPX62252.1 hypothetical protein D187_008439 [Cystobacter fuscus DSM 2262]
MSLKRYGVLKGMAVGRRLGAGPSPHYQVHLVDEQRDYRIAINVRSKLFPSELEYFIDEHFQHPQLERLGELPLGFTPLDSTPGGLALDYIRGNLFEPWRMRPLPHEVPGPDNDLNEKLDHFCQRAMVEEEAFLYAFGERWGPENKRDKYFGFSPGNGIHDIHMNQGNHADFAAQDGTWQDGGLLFHFPAQRQWVAVFLKFQSQAWHTDDRTGHALTAAPTEPAVETGTGSGPAPAPEPTAEQPDGLVRIVAALVNDTRSPERETVTLLNASAHPLSLEGWALADAHKRKHPLDGELAPGETRVVRVGKPMELSNQGGLITLLNERGLKVHGVSYSREQARRPGWSLVF